MSLHTLPSWGPETGVTPLYRRLTGFRLLPSFLEVSPFINANRQQLVIGAHHRGLETLAASPCRPPHRERNRRRCRRRRPQPRHHMLRLVLVGVAKHHQELVPSNPHHCFLGPHVTH